VLALTGLDLIQSPEVLEEIKKDHRIAVEEQEQRALQ
jgi:hypothetical protein